MKLLIPESGHQRRQQDLPSMCRGCRRAGPTSGAQRFAQRWFPSQSTSATISFNFSTSSSNRWLHEVRRNSCTSAFFSALSIKQSIRPETVVPGVNSGILSLKSTSSIIKVRRLGKQTGGMVDFRLRKPGRLAVKKLRLPVGVVGVGEGFPSKVGSSRSAGMNVSAEHPLSWIFCSLGKVPKSLAHVSCFISEL